VLLWAGSYRSSTWNFLPNQHVHAAVPPKTQTNFPTTEPNPQKKTGHSLPSERAQARNLQFFYRKDLQHRGEEEAEEHEDSSRPSPLPPFLRVECLIQFADSRFFAQIRGCVPVFRSPDHRITGSPDHRITRFFSVPPCLRGGFSLVPARLIRGNPCKSAVRFCRFSDHPITRSPDHPILLRASVSPWWVLFWFRLG